MATRKKPMVYRLPDDGVQLEKMEHDYLVQALERSGGSHSGAAKLMGISRHALRYRAMQSGLSPRPGGKPSKAPPRTKIVYVLPEKGVDLLLMQHEYLVQALERVDNSHSAAAKLMGVSRHALRYRALEAGLTPRPGSE
jgi:transcriptional regulator with PAS, ATPase and Fis domain